MEENTNATCNFGVHLTLDGYGGDPQKLNDGPLVLKCLNELPEILGMQRLIDPVVKECADNQLKDPGGHSGIVMIAESHISIHTFPARKFVSIDVYTCKNDMEKDFIVDYFKKAFGLEDAEINFIKRGTKYPVNNLV